MKLLIALSIFLSVLFIEQEKEATPKVDVKEQIDSLKTEQIKQENLRLRRISLRLYQYADPKKIKKDDELISDMIYYSSNELNLNKQ